VDRVALDWAFERRAGVDGGGEREAVREREREGERESERARERFYCSTNTRLCSGYVIKSRG